MEKIPWSVILSVIVLCSMTSFFTVASEAVEVLRTVVELTKDSHFHPVIDRCYDFSQMIAAHTHVDTGHKKGNVVITVTTDIQSQRRMVPTLPVLV